MAEHRSGAIPGFTQKYHCHKLVYFERFSDVNQAIAREKQLKKWSRSKKDWLIDTINKERRDLMEECHPEPIACQSYRINVIPSHVEGSLHKVEMTMGFLHYSRNDNHHTCHVERSIVISSVVMSFRVPITVIPSGVLSFRACREI